MGHIEHIRRGLTAAMLLIIWPAMAAHAQGDSAVAGRTRSYIQRPTLQIGGGLGYDLGGAYLDTLSRQRAKMPLLGAFSGYLELRAPRLFGERWGLQGRGEIQHRETAEREGYISWYYNKYSTTIRSTFSNYRVDAVRFDLLATFFFGLGGEVAFGPYVGYSDGAYVTTLLAYPVSDTMVYDARRGICAGGLFLLSFPIDLGADLALVPEVRARADIIDPGIDLQRFGIGIGLSLNYSLLKLPPVLSRPPLSSSVDIYALDDDGDRVQEARVHGGTLRRDRHLALAPIIAFNPSSSDLPSRYECRAASGRSPFRPDSIARLDAPVIERHLPDLIGAWLSSGREECRLVATVMRGEGEAVARMRAGSLRRYLSGTWGIDTARMAIVTEPGTRPEVRAERGGEKMMTFEAAWSEPRIVPPRIRIESSIDSTLGVKSWRLRLEHDGKVIAEQTSDTASKRMNMRELMSRLARDVSWGPVTAELVVEDSSGATSIADDALPLYFQGTVPLDDVNEYLMLGTLPPEDLVEKIIAVADTGTRVTITPISDHAGAREAASDLARKLHESGADARVVPFEDAEDLEGMSIEITRRGASLP